MASGRPDYTSQALIKGSDAGTHRTVAVDSAGNMLTLMKGQYGGAPVVVAVDSAGRLYGLLQGDYEGAFKTLAVDSLGRMLAVLTDPEDVFGNPHYMGSAELAARLGSPALVDRRGQVLFQDPGGLNLGQYVLTTNGASSTVVESGASSPLGGLSYKMTAGPAEDNYVRMTKYLPPITSVTFGLEAAVALHQDTKYWTLYLSTYTSLAGCQFGLRYDDVNGKLLYYDSGGTWTELATLALSLDAVLHAHTFKVVVNHTTRKYVRAIVDATQYDMSAISGYNPVAIGRHVSAAVELTAAAAGDVSAYQGNLVVTTNEV